jgi:hypothetical protein
VKLKATYGTYSSTSLHVESCYNKPYIVTKATTATTPTTTQTPTATSSTATTSTTQSTDKDTPSILNKIKNSDKGQIVGALTGILHLLTDTTSVDYRGHGHNTPPSHAFELASGCAIAVCSLVEGIKGRGIAAGEAATISAGAATTPEGVGIPVLAAGGAITAAGTALSVKGVMEAKTAAQIIPNAMALSSSKGNQPSQSSTSPRPTEKNPKSELPNSGTRPLVPPKQIGVGPNDIVKESAR